MSVKVICRQCNVEMPHVEPYYNECPKCGRFADPEMEWFDDWFEILYISQDKHKERML